MTDIKMPGVASGLSDAAVAVKLAQSLKDLAPQFLGYLIGFLVIAAYWMTHHRVFRYIRRYESRLIWLNVLLLLCIAFLPFPTSLISRYGDI